MRRDELDELSDVLGAEHDLAVMQARIASDPHGFAGYRALQALCGLIERRRMELQSRAELLGERLDAEEPDALGHRFEAYVSAWKRQAAEPWDAT